jgi:hypothetical protein
MNREELEIAQKNFRKRKAENDKHERIKNSNLRAGSPMYFYCRHCGSHTDTLPELYLGEPVTICEPCKELEKLGAIPND